METTAAESWVVVAKVLVNRVVTLVKDVLKRASIFSLLVVAKILSSELVRGRKMKKRRNNVRFCSSGLYCLELELERVWMMDAIALTFCPIWFFCRVP